MIYHTTEDGEIIPTDEVVELIDLFEATKDSFPEDVSAQIGELDGDLVLKLTCRYRIAQLRQARTGEWRVVPWADMDGPFESEQTCLSFSDAVESLVGYRHPIPSETAAYRAEVDSHLAEILKEVEQER